MRGSFNQCHTDPGTGALSARFAVVLLATFLAAPAFGQPVCSSEPVSNPERQVVTCGGGFRMEIEAGARATISARQGDAPPSVVELETGGVLVEIRSGGGSSQIRTPHAIAAVRGTEYIVDVSEAQTSVFVIEGVVDVRGHEASAGQVQLNPGEGVDVTDSAPLEVTIWPAERLAETLARFGR